MSGKVFISIVVAVLFGLNGLLRLWSGPDSWWDWFSLAVSLTGAVVFGLQARRYQRSEV